MSRRNEEYDWLNDPFDEKKVAEEMEHARSKKGALVALVVVVILCIVFFAFGATIFLGAAALV